MSHVKLEYVSPRNPKRSNSTHRQNYMARQATKPVAEVPDFTEVVVHEPCGRGGEGGKPRRRCEYVTKVNLRRCPLCGEWPLMRGKRTVGNGSRANATDVRIICLECGLVLRAANIQLVVTRWNRRCDQLDRKTVEVELVVDPETYDAWGAAEDPFAGDSDSSMDDDGAGEDNSEDEDAT